MEGQGSNNGCYQVQAWGTTLYSKYNTGIQFGNWFEVSLLHELHNQNSWNYFPLKKIHFYPDSELSGVCPHSNYTK